VYLSICYDSIVDGFEFLTLSGDGGTDGITFDAYYRKRAQSIVWAYDAALLLKNASNGAINGA
jgi:hypothetical protein